MTAVGHFATTYRTDLCGALRASDAGRRVRLGGWVHRTRKLGGLTFIDLRDRAGIVQVSFNPDFTDRAVIEQAAGLGATAVVGVDLDYETLGAGGGMLMVSASGTAVRLE